MTLRIALVLVAALVAPASAQMTRHRSISVADPWSRATSLRANIGAGYVTLRNTGARPDRLVSATSPRAARVEIHTMSLDGGIMRMRPLADGLVVPAGGEASLAPGGHHIMLIGLTAPLKVGERIPATLRFARAGDVRVQFRVVSAGSTVAGTRQGEHR